MNELVRSYAVSVLKSERWIVILSFVLSASLLFGGLGDWPLISPDEGRNAEVAREMSQSHSWLVPTYNGLVYLDKPAFYFKTVALSFSLFGESEGTARLSSACFGFGLLVMVFLFCRKMYDQRTGILAVLIVATTPLYMAFSRMVIFDMSLAFFVCAAIFACFLAEESEEKQKTRWYFAGAVAAGIATLIKGPVGFIIPTLVITIFNGVEGRLRCLTRVFAMRNWLVFFAIVLPWFVGLSLLRPDFPYYGIMKESIARFTTTEFRRTAPVFYYAPVIAGAFFAWSLLLPESIFASLRERSRWLRADRLFVTWAVIVVVFFSISQSKLPGYILTAVVVLGILTARIFARAFDNDSGRSFRIIWHGTMVLLLFSAIAAVTLGLFAYNPESLQSGIKVSHSPVKKFLPMFPSLALSFALVACLATLALWARNSRLIFAAFISFPLLLMTVNFDLLVNYAQSQSASGLSERIPKTLPSNTELACIECLPNGLPFYLKRFITVITRKGDELTSNYVVFTLSSGESWPDNVVPVDEMQQWLATRDHPVYLLAKDSHIDQLRDIAQHRGAEIVNLDTKYSAVLLPTPAGK